MIKSRQRFFNSLLVLIDASVISISLLLAWYIRFYSGLFYVESWRLDFEIYMAPLLLVIPVFLLSYYWMGLYTPYRTKKLYEEYINIFKASIIGTVIMVNLIFLAKLFDYSRYMILLFSLSNMLLLAAERTCVRLALRAARRRGYNQKHILVIGTEEISRSFVDKISSNKQLGYNIIGFIDEGSDAVNRLKDIKLLGGLDNLDEVLKKNDLDEVVVAISIKQYDKLQYILEECEKNGVKSKIIPDYYRYLPAKPYIDQLDDLPIITTRYVPLDDAFNKFFKRLMDIIFSSLLLIALSPLLIITSALIKLTSPGPVIFKQVRLGMNRREFTIYKFRSMHIDYNGDSSSKWTTRDDPRRTKFGEFIRKYSIDELPQLVNVLKGDMSIIGPRPERPYFVEKYKGEIPKYMVKHHVRPGITGWAQVNGYRGDTSIKSRIIYDIFYIENWSIWLDLKIVFLTLLRGFSDNNAY